MHIYYVAIAQKVISVPINCAAILQQDISNKTGNVVTMQHWFSARIDGLSALWQRISAPQEHHAQKKRRARSVAVLWDLWCHSECLEVWMIQLAGSL